VGRQFLQDDSFSKSLLSSSMDSSATSKYDVSFWKAACKITKLNKLANHFTFTNKKIFHGKKIWDHVCSIPSQTVRIGGIYTCRVQMFSVLSSNDDSKLSNCYHSRIHRTTAQPHPHNPTPLNVDRAWLCVFNSNHPNILHFHLWI